MTMKSSSIGIVFIHGAGLGSWIWKDVIPEVSLPAKAIDFPKRSTSFESRKSLTLDDYTTDTINQLRDWQVEKIVLVAHSLGGIIAMKIAQALGEKLAGFISVGAAIPHYEGTFFSSLSFPQNIIMPLIIRLSGTKPTRSAIVQGLCNDLSPHQTERVVKKFIPESPHIYTDKLHAKAPRTKTLYIKLTKDKEFGKRLQNRMISHLNHPEVVTLSTGHMPMLSQPKELAAIINSFIEKI